MTKVRILPSEFEEQEELDEKERLQRFPKRVGVVFIEERRHNESKFGLRRSHALKLNFDQIACAHFLLQMNNVQSIFDFQIVVPPEEYFKTPFKNDIDTVKEANASYEYDKLLNWFNSEIDNFEKSERNNEIYSIDYWIGITSEGLSENRFCSKCKFPFTFEAFNEVTKGSEKTKQQIETMRAEVDEITRNQKEMIQWLNEKKRWLEENILSKRVNKDKE
jgi:hypothetical protein